MINIWVAAKGASVSQTRRMKTQRERKSAISSHTLRRCQRHFGRRRRDGDERRAKNPATLAA